MKKIFAFLLAIVIAISSFGVIAYAEGTEDNYKQEIETTRSSQIASVLFNNFYYTTTQSTLTLSQTCHYVSVNVSCASGTDTMVLEIVDVTNQGLYNTTLPFTADGLTNTFGAYLPAGVYRVSLFGSNVLHTYGVVVFST